MKTLPTVVIFNKEGSRLIVNKIDLQHWRGLGYWLEGEESPDPVKLESGKKPESPFDKMKREIKESK